MKSGLQSRFYAGEDGVDGHASRRLANERG